MIARATTVRHGSVEYVWPQPRTKNEGETTTIRDTMCRAHAREMTFRQEKREERPHVSPRRLPRSVRLVLCFLFLFT